MKKYSSKIACDVCCCKHNQKGCDCSLDGISVTTGTNLKDHYCSSYECKPEYIEPSIISDTCNYLTP